MKQVVFLSGKGGTGKTFITSNIASLSDNGIVVDADVDASNLNILFNADISGSELFRSGYEAVIDQEKCIKCGKCAEACRFQAVEETGAYFRINHLSCEGCGTCAIICPEDAVAINPGICGKWYKSMINDQPFFHAELFPGSDNSGKLVTLIRKAAEKAAEEQNRKLIMIDGPPGTACPAMAALTNTDLAVIITEPTASAVHDLERILGLVKSFRTEALVVINKYTINEMLSRKISDLCSREGAELIARIPFSERAAESVSQRKIYVKEYNDQITETLKDMHDIIADRIEKI